MVPWNAAKTKVQLRLAVQRLRILQEKKQAQAKSTRRDIATLIERGRVETARIKVENIINEDIHVELLELLELYCELLIARFGLLDLSGKEPDPGIHEAVCSIIYAAPRTELKELHILREMLMHKFGREFSLAVIENRNNCVSERVVRKLSVGTPAIELVEAYVEEIARGYGIEYISSLVPKVNKEDFSGEGDELAQKAPSTANVDDTKAAPEKSADDVQSTLDAKATASKLPDIPPTDTRNPSPQPPPYMPTAKPLKSALKKPDSASPGGGENGDKPVAEDDFVSLAKRLDALKKR
ncbi:hypothetical protein Clacol_007657 [Clathrus columnatus]|uniref:IST1 homolog n=1 Tax=Clathrus columnatus TaxID=1419009 RepID=A0AAV5AJX2_9AGAM|nr:hypothetical protein Clacol_007657 [Clathrus columnatus]